MRREETGGEGGKGEERTGGRRWSPHRDWIFASGWVHCACSFERWAVEAHSNHHELAGAVVDHHVAKDQSRTATARCPCSNLESCMSQITAIRELSIATEVVIDQSLLCVALPLTNVTST